MMIMVKLRIILTAIMMIAQFASCNFECGLDGYSSGFGGCRSVAASLKAVQISGFGACGAASNSRKLKISCDPSSGSNQTCKSRSNGSGYFAVLVPDNNHGSFIDKNYSTVLGKGPIADCNTLWSAMNAPDGAGPSDIAGVYHGDPSAGDSVTCTDSQGCRVTSANCFSAWDPVSGSPTGTTASISNGSYLICSFIDSPYSDTTLAQGAPPLMGLPAALISSSTPDNFSSVVLKNPTTTPILLNNWVDYQVGVDRCSTTTNSRKIGISCPAGSGTQSACTSRSNGSGYFVVVVPNNGGGTFIDSNYSTALGNGPITSCATLWAALSGADGSRPSDITGYYHGDPAAGESVTCDDVTGCVAKSSDCFSAWDSVLQLASGRAATIANGSYLSCAFLDAPYPDGTPAQGAPPAGGVGLIGTSASTDFGSAVFSSPGQSSLSLTTWTDY